MINNYTIYYVRLDKCFHKGLISNFPPIYFLNILITLTFKKLMERMNKLSLSYFDKDLENKFMKERHLRNFFLLGFFSWIALFVCTFIGVLRSLSEKGGLTYKFEVIRLVCLIVSCLVHLIMKKRAHLRKFSGILLGLAFLVVFCIELEI